MTTRASTFALLLFFSIGCAGGSGSVALSHTGGVSGIEERYTIDRQGHMMEQSKLSQDTLKIVRMGVADRATTERIFSFLERHESELDTLKLQGSGNLTTALTITEGKRIKSLRWAYLDPPRIQSTAVDSLYQLMLSLQEQIGKLPATTN